MGVIQRYRIWFYFALIAFGASSAHAQERGQLHVAIQAGPHFRNPAVFMAGVQFELTWGYIWPTAGFMVGRARSEGRGVVDIGFNFRVHDGDRGPFYGGLAVGMYDVYSPVASVRMGAERKLSGDAGLRVEARYYLGQADPAILIGVGFPPLRQRSR